VTKLKGNFEGFINHTGLYRVWVPLRNDGQAPLISVWIDPMMNAFEPQACDERAAMSDIGKEEIVGEIEDPTLRGPQMATHPSR
jgi:hypothetical protein